MACVSLISKLRAAVAALADPSVADGAQGTHEAAVRSTVAALCATPHLSPEAKLAVWEVALQLWCGPIRATGARSEQVTHALTSSRAPSAGTIA